MQEEHGAALQQDRTLAPSFWGLDPLFWTFAKVNIGTIFRAKVVPPHDNQFWLGQRALKTVHIVATVVCVDRKPDKTLYALDDGTGIITATVWHNSDKRGLSGGSSHGLRSDEDQSDIAAMVPLGSLVRCQGRLQTGNDVHSRTPVEISVYSFHIVIDPNEQLLHWLQCEQLLTNEYLQHPPDAHFNRRRIEKKMKQRAKQALERVVGADTQEGDQSGNSNFDAELEGVLARRIARWLESETSLNSVTFNNLVAVEPLQQAAVQDIRQSSATSPTGSDAAQGAEIKTSRGNDGKAQLSPTDEVLVLARFRKAARELRRKGYISLVDETRDLYALVSLKRFVQPKIMQLFDAQQRRRPRAVNKSAQHGLHEVTLSTAEIFAHIRALPACVHTSVPRLQLALVSVSLHSVAMSRSQWTYRAVCGCTGGIAGKQ